MSLDDSRTIDAAGIEESTCDGVLTIADEWEWDDERRHSIALQEKLNAYFEFVETGQIQDSYPPAAGRRMRIDVIFRFPPPAIAVEFLDRAAAAAAELDLRVTHRVEQCDSWYATL